MTGGGRQSPTPTKCLLSVSIARLLGGRSGILLLREGGYSLLYLLNSATCV